VLARLGRQAGAGVADLDPPVGVVLAAADLDGAGRPVASMAWRRCAQGSTAPGTAVRVGPQRGRRHVDQAGGAFGPRQPSPSITSSTSGRSAKRDSAAAVPRPCRRPASIRTGLTARRIEATQLGRRARHHRVALPSIRSAKSCAVVRMLRRSWLILATAPPSCASRSFCAARRSAGSAGPAAHLRPRAVPHPRGRRDDAARILGRLGIGGHVATTRRIGCTSSRRTARNSSAP
jgi:hypothetical protein